MNFTDLIPLVVPLVTLLGGWFFGRKMEDARVKEKEAEAMKTLAEAEGLMATADAEENRVFIDVVAAWRTLFQDMTDQNQNMRERLSRIEAEQKDFNEKFVGLKNAYDKLWIDFQWYKYGVSVLIRQIRRLMEEPDWTPDIPNNLDKGEKET